MSFRDAALGELKAWVEGGHAGGEFECPACNSYLRRALQQVRTMLLLLLPLLLLWLLLLLLLLLLLWLLLLLLWPLLPLAVTALLQRIVTNDDALYPELVAEVRPESGYRLFLLKLSALQKRERKVRMEEERLAKFEQKMGFRSIW